MPIEIKFDSRKAVQMFQSLKAGKPVIAATRDEKLLLAGVCLFAVTHDPSGMNWDKVPANEQDATVEQFFRDMFAAIETYAQLTMFAVATPGEYEKVFPPSVDAVVTGLEATIAGNVDPPKAHFREVC